MPFLLRKVHKAWWLPDGHEEWLLPGHAQGDSLGDLETDDNTLSFWVIDDTRSNLNRVLSALAAKGTTLSNIDYCLVPQAAVAAIPIRSVESIGDTPDQDANRHWHNDLVQLTATKIAQLANLIQGVGPAERLEQKAVKLLLAEAIVRNEIDQTHLNLQSTKDKQQLQAAIEGLRGPQNAP